MRHGTNLIIALTFPASAFAQPIEWPESEGGNGHYYEVIEMPLGVSEFAFQAVAQGEAVFGEGLPRFGGAAL